MIPYDTHKVIFQTPINLGSLNFNYILPTYTTMMFIALLLGIYVVQKNSYIKKIDLIIKLKILIMGTIATMVGGRLFYLIFYQKETWYKIPLKMFTIWQVGSVSYGGLALCLLALYFLTKHYKLSMLKVLDRLAPSFGIGMFAARLGCFFAGCCHGKPTTMPWGIEYNNQIVHATPIYSSIYNLVIFLITFHYLSTKPKDGKVFGLYLILYGISRFSVEFLRINPLYYGLSLQQIISIPLIIIGLLLFFIKTKNHKKSNN